MCDKRSFSGRAPELKLNSQVGNLGANFLSTDGGRGLLFFGPYVSLQKGKYILRIAGNFDNVDGAVLDVVSDKGNLSHFRGGLSKIVVPNENLIEISFSLENNASDLEVRLYVEEVTNVRIKFYEVVLSSID